MSTPTAKKNRPVSISFFDIFGAPRSHSNGLLRRSGTICRDASGRPALVRIRKKVQSPKIIDDASTKAEPPQSPKPEEPPQSPKPEVPPHPEAPVNTWTTVEDAALLGMKAMRKSWTEISENMAGKDLEAIKDRYRLLYAEAPPEVKEIVAEAKPAGQNEEGKEKNKKGNEATTKGKGKPSDKGTKTPVLNKGKAREDADEDLSPEDINRLQQMKNRYDERKWVELASRFFDMFGKRVDPDVLKDRLK